MNDLPIPAPASPVGYQAQPQPVAVGVPSISQASQAAQNDEAHKMLQAQAAERVEAAILQTTTSPAERARLIHSIKADYIKARYGIDVKGAA